MFHKPTLLAASVRLARSRLHHTAYHGPNLLRLNTSTKFMHGSPISLQLIVPPSVQPQAVIASNPEELDDLVQSYCGSLRGPGSNGTTELILRSRYPELSPTEVYEIVSPYFNSVQEEQHHRQVADKAFVEKARNRLFKLLKDNGTKYRELDRTIENDGKAVSEWEAIVELESGEVVLLECKHCVTTTVVFEQVHRMRKTMKALRKDYSLGRVFVAGEHWRAMDGDDPREAAQEEGFGLLFESGNDLTVISCRGL